MGLENPIHLALLLVILLLVFGAKRLPEMGRGLGDGMRTFKDAISGDSHPEGLIAHEAHEPSVATVPAPSAPLSTSTPVGASTPVVVSHPGD